MNKRELVDDFLNALDDYTNEVATDATRDCGDSYYGIGSWKAKEKMEKAFYKLFDIEFEEEGNKMK